MTVWKILFKLGEYGCTSGKGKTMVKSLYQRLLDAGYPKTDIFNHETDMYIYVTPLTARIVDNYYKETGYTKSLFVSTFKDQVAGRAMYDIAFEYIPRWEEIEELSARINKHIGESN